MKSTNDWDLLEKVLTEIIKNSRRPDYLDHAITTREWLLKLEPTATEELKMSAFGHDIERCFFAKMIEVADEPYLSYKTRHAQRCADILSSLMLGMGFSQESAEKVHHYVSLHEEGGDRECDLIRDADSLSFMSNNLPHYLEENGKKRTAEKVSFMYNRASDRAKELIKTMGVLTNNLELAKSIT